MTASNYDACESRVLASEGGYSDNVHDPGGPTNFGVTIYDARLYWKRDATAADVKAMPLAVAQDIYRRKYWNALNCDALPSGLDYTVFDYGVNSGISRSGKVLRQCMGFASWDWHVTPDVIAALAKRDIPALISEIDAERLAFLEHLKTWPDFGKGWSARVSSVKSISLHMANQSVAPVPAAYVATPDMPTAKAVAAPDDLFAHLTFGEGWAELWREISKL